MACDGRRLGNGADSAAPTLDPATRHLTIVRRANADSASHVVESATSLHQAVWPTDKVTLLSVTPDGNGNEILIYQTPSGPVHFFRVRVTVP